ncbi:hypothetical protein RSAG8_02034, partial [Rhizoctonia solani AG-8 WAC10335]
MLTGATESDAVELAEDAETISLMLAFIYPVDPPSITTVEQPEKVMLSSQKYNIEKLTKYIEKSNRWDSQLILSDPIRVFRASVMHGFPTIQTLSAKRFGLKFCDYRSSKGLEELARLLPEFSGVIGLIGAAIARDEILKVLRNKREVKPKYNEHHQSLSNPCSYHMICSSCWDESRNTVAHRIYSVYNRGWMSHWFQQLHSRLSNLPTDPCEDLFSVGSIIGAGCSACVTQTLANHYLFGPWARSTKQYVDKELGVLENLYSL